MNHEHYELPKGAKMQRIFRGSNIYCIRQQKVQHSKFFFAKRRFIIFANKNLKMIS